MIQPILNYLLEIFHQWTSNYGLSIVLLSLAVMVIMYPLFWLSELIIEIHRAKLQAMKPALDKLKEVSNKHETYYYTQTIYRQFGYKQWYSFAGLIGLMIQIPFFLAAYSLLEFYPALDGISFLGIPDLLLPDGIIQMGTLSINALPILMTLINLVGVYLGSKHLKPNENYQLIGIAVLFLVLLYHMPSGLVLYWTCNNLFAIPKNALISKKFAHASHKNAQRILFKAYHYMLSKKDILALLSFSLIIPLSFYLQNIQELEFLDGWLIYMLCAAGIYLIYLFARKLYPNNRSAALTLTYTIYLFSYLSAINMWLETVFEFWKLRYTLLIILLITFLFFRLFAKTSLVNWIAKIIQIFALMAMMYIITIIGIKHEYIPAIFDKPNEKYQSSSPDSSKYPDIYYIMLDAYSNSQTLQDLLGFDNSYFIDSLNNLGFHTLSDSRSNYISTYQSVTSTLNYTYLDSLISKPRLTTASVFDLHTKQEPRVFSYLKHKGYTSINLSSSYFYALTLPYVTYNFAKSSDLFTPFGHHFMTQYFYYLYSNILKHFFQKESSEVFSMFSQLLAHPKIPTPKFYYAHVYSPHPPYLVDSLGNLMQSPPISEGVQTGDHAIGAYLRQTKYLNGQILQSITPLIKEKSDAIIIIQSDHGSSFSYSNATEKIEPHEFIVPNRAFYQERFRNFTSVRFGTDSTSSLYEGMSNVNTFRVIFNQLFGDSLPTLPDQTFINPYMYPALMEDITEELNMFSPSDFESLLRSSQ